MSTTIKPSKAIESFIKTHAASPAEHDHPQMISFPFANGRRAVIFLKDNGGFDSSIVYRGENVVGHPSTLKGLAALGQ